MMTHKEVNTMIDNKITANMVLTWLNVLIPEFDNPVKIGQTVIMKYDKIIVSRKKGYHVSKNIFLS